MSNLLQRAKFLDLYALKPSLTFGKDRKVYSHLGLLLTVLTVLAIGSLFIYESIQVFGRKRPSFIQYSVPVSGQKQKIPFNTDTLDLLLATTNDVDSSKFYTMDGYYQLDGSKTTPITVSACSGSSPSEDLYCLSQSEETKSETSLGNGYTGEALMIHFSPCVNSAANGNSCFSTTEINSLLTTTSFALLYSNWIVNPTDFDQPLKPSLSLFQDPFLSSLSKVLSVTLDEIEFVSDNGWLFEDLKTETRFRATTNVYVKEKTDTSFFTLQLTYSDSKTVYKRTYPKIQDLLAQVNGILATIIAVCLVLVYPYANLQKVQYLVNETFEIKHLEKPAEEDQNKLSESSPKSPENERTLSPTTPDVEANLLPKNKGKTKTPKASKNTIHPICQPKTEAIEEKMGNPEAPEHTSVDINPLQDGSFRKNSKTLPPIKGAILINQPTQNVNCSLKDSSDLVELKNLGENSVEATDKQPHEDEIHENSQENIEEEEIPDNIKPDQEDANSLESAEKIPLRASSTIQIGWTDWIRSFFKASLQVQMLKEAEERISETLDLVTLSKKIIEIDKLKACLLTHDQRVIFDHLPSSVIVVDSSRDVKSKEAFCQYYWKQCYKGDEWELKEAYWRIKREESKEKVDKRLLSLYESECMEDHDAVVRKN